MDSRFEEPRGARTSLSEEVRQTADALATLLERTGAVPTPIRTAVRAACDGVSRRLSETRLTFALVGDAGAGRRTLVNALLGDRVLPTNTPRRGSTITIVRRAPTLEFSACSTDGRSVARLSRKMPDRGALFEKSMAQLDRETTARDALAARVQALRERAAALEGVAPPAPVRSPLGAARLWQAVWSWILRVLLRPSWLRLSPPRTGSDEPARAPREPGAVPAARLEQERAEMGALERELEATRSVEQLTAQAERLRLERQKYEEERRATFLAQVRDFDGTDIGERVVEYPAKHLPEGLTLIDLPCPPVVGAPVVEALRSRVARDVDALVVVADIARPPGDATVSLVHALRDLAPVVLVVLTKADGLELGTDRVAGALGANAGQAPFVLVAAESVLDAQRDSSPLADEFRATIGALSERLECGRPVVVAWREAMRLRVAIAELSRSQAREEESCRKRLSALESKRIPDPAAFRMQLVNRLDGAIEQGADAALATATASLHAAIERLRSEWTEGIASCTARGEVDARVALIDESAAVRIAEALEQTAESLARELHDATETIEGEAIEEIHGHYRLVRRLGAEALAPVASELTREDLERELLAAQPIEGALDAFEKQRVGFGLKGVAAGAVLGTLIAPGIGTAVGAVLGVFAGLLKGTDSLKQECFARIEACLNETESHARAQLQGKRADVSRVIRVALDEALQEELGRLEGAITRLMSVERRAIDREREKLGSLTTTLRALETCDERLARVVERASCANAEPGVPASRPAG